MSQQTTDNNGITMASTGIKGLDEIICELTAGDNVVWQIDDVEDYKDLVGAFTEAALKSGKRIVYIRFADHSPVVAPHEHIRIFNLDVQNGFESFSRQVNDIITREGAGVYYIFDCLSDLLSKWATDLMVGNFFMVTCPYLFKLENVSYFSIIRNKHSFKTVARIRETTQLLIDVYNCEGSYYVHPLKVENRYSSTMFFPHLREGEKFVPISDSFRTSKLFSKTGKAKAEDAKRNLDHWDRLFLEAEDLVTSSSREEKKEMVERLCRIMISKDDRILELARKNFELEDLLNIKSGVIGTGFIYGPLEGEDRC